MVSQIKVNEIIKQSGSSISIGESGDTITLPSTATLSNFPNNTPYFGAYLTSNQSVSTGASTIVTYNAEFFDSGGFFDTSTYRFTPTVSGYYEFFAQVKMDSSTDFNMLIINLRKNGSNVANGQNNNDHNNSVCTSAIIQLNGSSDYVDVRMLQNSGGSANVAGGSTETFIYGKKLIT